MDENYIWNNKESTKPTQYYSKNLIIILDFSLSSMRMRHATSLHIFEFLLEYWQNVGKIGLQGQHCVEHKTEHFGPNRAVVKV